MVTPRTGALFVTVVVVPVHSPFCLSKHAKGWWNDETLRYPKANPSTTTAAAAAGQSTPWASQSVLQEDFHQTTERNTLIPNPEGGTSLCPKSLAKFCCFGWGCVSCHYLSLLVLLPLLLLLLLLQSYGPWTIWSCSFRYQSTVSGAFIQKVRAHTVKH